ncbi:MAG: ABC transporter substrate-binding protein, partial [Bdellovibrionales bacterium]
VDIAQNEMGPDKVKDFLSQPDRFQVQTYPGLNMIYMLINFHDKWLSNPIVRRALAHAIDRQSIIQYKLFNLAEAATSILSPINPFFSKELQNPEFDSKKSADLIRSAGAVEHTLTLKTSNDPTALAVGRVLAHQLRESGLKIKHESYEWATYYADIKKGAFELATMKWVGIVDPDIYRAAFLSTETPPGRNRGFYKNPQVDTILNQAQKAEDFAERSKLFGQVQRLVHQDLAIIPLWYDRQVAIAQSNIRDYHPIATSDYRALTKVYKETH